MTYSTKPSRRDFLKTSSGLFVAGSTLSPSLLLAADQAGAKNDRPQVAVIGTGWRPDIKRVGRGIPIAREALKFGDLVAICDVDQVVFVDASLTLDKPYQIEPLVAEDSPSIGSHTLSPGGVLALAKALYQHCPRAYVVAIKGYAFDDFQEALSEGARKNLDSALDAFETYFGLRANGGNQ